MVHHRTSVFIFPVFHPHPNVFIFSYGSSPPSVFIFSYCSSEETISFTIDCLQMITTFLHLVLSIVLCQLT